MLSVQRTNRKTGKREVLGTYKCKNVYNGEVEIDPHRIVWEKKGKVWVVSLDDENRVWLTLRNGTRYPDGHLEHAFTTKEFKAIGQALMEAGTRGKKNVKRRAK